MNITAGASESLGPFEYEHQCLVRGDQGVQRGEWPDYECVGSYGAWRLIPGLGRRETDKGDPGVPLQ